MRRGGSGVTVQGDADGGRKGLAGAPELPSLFDLPPRDSNYKKARVQRERAGLSRYVTLQDVYRAAFRAWEDGDSLEDVATRIEEKPGRLKEALATRIRGVDYLLMVGRLSPQDIATATEVPLACVEWIRRSRRAA